MLVGSAAGWARADDGFTPGSGGALTLRADPARLVLGQDAGAELRIAAPVGVEELSVTASVGKVEGLRRLPEGGFAARYRPPPERYPQVAILAAVARTGAGALDGWLAVPLAGRGDARVPGQPGSDVSLRIGDRSFGPGRVGEDGIALIPVVVPPGVREAHRGFRAVDLHVPETSLVHAAGDRVAVQADRSEAVRVFAYVVAPHGAARKADPPRVEVTRGSLALQPREPGAYVGTWTLPPGPTGEERATIRLEGSPASKAVLRVAVQAGPPAALVLGLDRTTVPAGAVEEVQITARALDASGNPAAGSPVVSADAGSLTQEEAGPGLVRARLRIDPRFQGREQVLVRARIPSGGASAVQAVTLAPGPAARAVLTPERKSVRADGHIQALLGLELWDAFQNPATGSPRVTADAGSTTLEPTGPGRWAVHYRAQAAEPASVRVVAELDDARGQADLLLVPPASSQLAFFAAGGGLAGISSSVSGGQLLAGAELPVRQWLPLPADRALALRLELAGIEGRRSLGNGHQIQTGAAVLAGPVLKGILPRARWFASGTAGFLVGSARGPGGSSGAGLGLAARLGLGLAVPVRRSAPFLELGFLGAGGPGGGVRAMTLSLGVRLDVFRADEAGTGE